MALLRCDSFSHYTTLTHKWGSVNTGSGGTFNIEPTVSPWGTGVLSWGGSSTDGNEHNHVGDALGVNASTIYAGFRFRITQNQTRFHFYNLMDGAAFQVGIGMNSSYQLNVYSGSSSTSLGNSGLYLFPNDGSWHYIEIKVVIHNTTGSVEVKVDGTVRLTATNINTRAGSSNNYANVFRLGGAGQDYVRVKLCDFYICDDQSAINNTYLGDVRVECLMPSGAGTTTNFTPSAGSNFQNVDETAPNDDTDYNSSSTVGNKDTFAMANLAATTGTIKGVQVFSRARKDDAGTRTLKNKVRSGATEGDGASVNMATSYDRMISLFETNPATVTAWTPTEVNAMEAGYEVVA